MTTTPTTETKRERTLRRQRERRAARTRLDYYVGPEALRVLQRVVADGEPTSALLDRIVVAWAQQFLN